MANFLLSLGPFLFLLKKNRETVHKIMSLDLTRILELVS